MEVGVLSKANVPFSFWVPDPIGQLNFGKGFFCVFFKIYASVICKVRMCLATDRVTFKVDSTVASSPGLSFRHRLSPSSVPPAA